MKKFFIILLTGIIVIDFAMGEGTKEVSPNSSYNVQLQINRSSSGGYPSTFAGWTATSQYDRLFFHIKDYTTETVYFGFRKVTSSQNVQYRIKRPDGTIVLGPTAIPTSGTGYISTWTQATIGPSNLTGNTDGYTASTFTPAVNGDFYIEFNVGTTANTTEIFLLYYDITIANGPANSNVIKGRLWSYNWGFNTGDYTYPNSMYGSLFVYPSDSVVTEIDLNGLSPYYFRIYSNHNGVQNNANIDEDRKSRYYGTGVTPDTYPEYPLFLNNPDSTIYITAKNANRTGTFVNLSGCPGNYCFNVTVNGSALAELNLDLNNNGSYTDAIDRTLDANVSLGPNCIGWDGLDGLGNVVAGNLTFKIQLSTKVGVTHFPEYDAEENYYGYLAANVRPTGIGTLYLYWDDSDPNVGGVAQLTGQVAGTPVSGSGVGAGLHTWTDPFGNQKTINTWFAIRKTVFTNITVVTIPPLAAGISAQTNVNCFGGNTGSATVTASGGTTPYSYKWNTTPQQTITTINDLTARTYIVTVTDFYGCTKTASANITQPATALAAGISTITHVNCFGGNTGTMTVTVTGGTSGYTYRWNTVPAQSTSTAGTLTNGAYTVTVTDTKGCTKTATGTITQPGALAINTAVTNVLCNGYSTGAINITVTGGVTAYIYRWSNNATSQNISNLSAITYTVTVTDGKSCTKTGSWALTQPAALGISAAVTNIACNGIPTGAINITVTGGVTGYLYKWSNNASTQNISGLSAITYTVTVTDGNSCTKTGSWTLTQPGILVLNTAVTHVTCNGNSTGIINLTVTGGTTVYGYNWSNGATIEDLSGLSAAIYTVTVTDANGCSKTASSTITEPGTMAINASVTNVLCNGYSTGAISITVTGGVTAYLYKWSNNATIKNLTNLSAVTYTVTVTDGNSCTKSGSWTLTSPGAIQASIPSHTDLLCYGYANGTATATATGGTQPYKYTWSTTPAQTTSTATGLSATTYTVTVTDANNCPQSTASVTLSQPGAIQASIPSHTDLLCNGYNNGTATATATGGTQPYKYTWSTTPAQTTSTATGLSATTYTVTVTDANNCPQSTASVTLSQPGAIQASIPSHTDLLCNGYNNGTATATATGGTKPYKYTWSTTPAQTTSTATGLSATTYTVTVTDANNCPQSTASVTLSQPGAIQASIPSHTDLLCNGYNNGTATATATGGTKPYKYTWSTTPAQTTSTATGLSATTYTVTVTDANNCPQSTASVTLSQPGAIQASIPSHTDLLCNGYNNGTATATATGGTQPYKYTWSTTPAQTTSTATGLSATTYTVTVTDANNCPQSTASVTLSQPGAIQASIPSHTDLLCNGYNNGTATATATGGTQPYKYTWSTTPAQTTSTATGLSATTYTVTVTDANNCPQSTASVTLSQPGAIQASIPSHTDLLCNGYNNGTATATATGGTQPYKYTWSTTPAQTTSTATGLSATTYTVTVTDANNCPQSTASVTLSQPGAIQASIPSHTDLLCNGYNNGTATATATGGTQPYKYTWSTTPAQTTSTATGLSATTYTVTVTDANNCPQSTASVTLSQPGAIQASIPSHTDLLCYGYANGTATATATGGTQPYKYTWSTTPAQTTSTATGLSATTYTVTVTDANNCPQSTASVTLSQPGAIQASIPSHTDLLCNGYNNGTATATATGGTQPYKYTWSTTPAQTTSTATGLSATTYTVTVTDANNCPQSTASVTLSQPGAIQASIPSHTDLLCNGYNNGTATATATGGTQPYKYTWSTTPAQTTSTATGLSATTYTVTVTDANNCPQSTASVTLSQPGAIQASIPSHTDLLCNGYNNGTATATATGGTQPYKYTWSTTPAQTTSTATGLSATTYTVTVTDANNCPQSTASVTLSQPGAIQASIPSHTDLLCNGYNNGTATATATGGTKPYKYTWSTTPAQTTSTATGLSATTYTVTVTDANNCPQSTASVTLSQPGAIQASIPSHTDLLCNGYNNGTATATATGGTKPYKYTWSTTPAQTTSTATGLSATTYTVTVTDANNCPQSTASVTLSQPGAIQASIPSHTDLLCNGYNNGTATATATGGTQPYKYTWSTTPAQTTSTATGLSATTYTVTVTDANNCPQSMASVTLSQPGAIQASIPSHTDLLCNGYNNGTATATATGGTQPYKYTWSTTPAQTTSTATGLSATTYTVTVTDANNCPQSTASVTLSQPGAIQASIPSHTDLLCNGYNNGTATATATGGTQPYKYTWSTTPAQTTSTATGLSATTYTVTVTDANNCPQSTASVTLSQPGAIQASIPSHTDLLCNGYNNGTATATATGGTQPYKYTWSTTPAQTTSTATGLSATTYTVTVTDANNCPQSTASVTLSQPGAIQASIPSHTDLLCNGYNNGTATATATGGTQPYKYTWSTIPAQTTSTATGLSATTYTVTVTDANNCPQSTASVTLSQPGAIQASIPSHTDLLCNGYNNGTATATATGGTQPYKYTWSTTPAQTTSTATGLSATTYTVTVTDANNCPQSTASVTLSQPGAIQASIPSHTDLLCNGYNNGTATATATGGTKPYKYTWSTTPAQTTSTATGLSATTYTVTVTDANNCPQSTASVTLSQPGAIQASIPSHTDLLCNGYNNGTATATATGGTQPYKYTWSTTPAQTTSTATGLSATTYTVTVTDANNCPQSTASVTLSQPGAIQASIPSHTDLLCNGYNNGTATATATGGTQPYKYTWSTTPAQTTSTATGLSATTYTVTVTDANNCPQSTASVTLSQPGAIQASIPSHTDLLCNGYNNGTATATATGGTQPYKYTWSTTPAQTTSTATGLSATTYTVTVTDANNCPQSTASVTLSQPGAIQASIPSHTDLLCNGYNNGTATATATGGTQPYKYTWSTTPAQTTSTATGLSATTYTVTVTDANNCPQSTASVTLSQPGAIQASIPSHTDLLCNGYNNGTATATATGGTQPYKYTWSTTPAQTTSTATGLSATTYTVTVTDANNCPQSTASVTLSQPGAIQASIPSHTDLLCNGYNNGTATATATGGTQPYKYTWSTTPAQTTSTATGLSATTYTVTVTDANNCPQSTASVTLSQPGAIQASIPSHTDLLCNGYNNGTATATATGGTKPYKYTWSTTPAQTTSTATGLSATTYTVTVTDANNCPQSTASVTLSQPGAIQASIPSHTDLLCNGYNNGTATATATGGTQPYKYTWSTTPAQTTSTATGLSATTYTVTVTDANNCPQSTASVTITQPDALSLQFRTTNVSCFSLINGEVCVTANGGTPAYSYLWTTGESTQCITGLSTGTYTVTVSDANGCAETTSATVTEPTDLIANALPSPVLCNGGSTGSVDLEITGGTAFKVQVNSPYVASLGATNASFGPQSYNITADIIYIPDNGASKLGCNPYPAGSLTGKIAMIDRGICPFVTKVQNAQDAGAIGVIIVQNTAGPPVPMGGSSGTITIPPMMISFADAAPIKTLLANSIVVNGTLNSTSYQYLWSNGATTQDLSSISADTYTVTVTDLNGCTKTTSATVTEPTDIVTTVVPSPVICNGGSTGSIDLEVTGGTAYKVQVNSPYIASLGATTAVFGPQSYNITGDIIYIPDNGASTLGCNPYPAGSLTGKITMIDRGICPFVTKVQNAQDAGAIGVIIVRDTPGPPVPMGGSSSTITIPSMMISFADAEPIKTLLANSIVVNATLNSTSYQYLWSNGATTQDLANISADTYTVTVTDANGCTKTDGVTITQPDALSLQFTTVNVTCFATNNGEISVTASGGTPAYGYLWNTGATVQGITGLTAGSYTVTVTDSHSCTISGSATVTSGQNFDIIICGPDPVCQGQTVQYCLCEQVTIPGVQYQWTIIGGTIVCCPNNPCVYVKWDNCIIGQICLTISSTDPQYQACSITVCKSVVVKPTPQPNITGPLIVNVGQTATYCTPAEPGDDYNWSVLGGSVNSGQGTNCITVTWNTNCSSCQGMLIVNEIRNGCCGIDTLYVTILPGTGNLTGYVTYKNVYNTGLNGVILELRDSQANIVGTALTGPNPATNDPGYYSFSNVGNGTYHLGGNFNGTWGGNNATDALIIELHTAHILTLTGLNLKMGDVNADLAVNSTDALWVKLRTVGMIGYYPAGDWKIQDSTFTLTGSASIDLKGLCEGDVNGSYIPSGFKDASFLSQVDDGTMTVPVGESFDYDIRSNGDAMLGAMTMFLGYDRSRFEVEKVVTDLDGMKYLIKEGKLSLAWSNTIPMVVSNGDPIITLRMKVKESLNSPTKAFKIKVGSEFAGSRAERFDNFDLRMPDLKTYGMDNEFSLGNYPNPFSNTTTIVYHLPEQAHVKLVLMNMFGEVLQTLVDAGQAAGSYQVKVNPLDWNLNPGVYLYGIQVNGVTNTYNKINKMVYTR